MAFRRIFREHEPFLRKTSREVTKFDTHLCRLLDDMCETMRKADGVGLAAVQIGVLRRCFVIEYEEKKYEFVNPQIVSQEGEDTAKEGCLSIDHKKDGLVTRPLKLTIKYQTRTGEKKQDSFEGWVARIICHENDHLDGVLFIDKVIETPKN